MQGLWIKRRNWLTSAGISGGRAISRGQQSDVISTAKSQNATDFGNAQSSLGSANTDISDYQDQLAKFVSGNPYTAGGEYDRTIDSGLANTSDAGANSLAGALQGQSLRTGQNSAASLATAKSGAQQNTRDLSSALASAQGNRINSEAGYNQTALGASSTPAQIQSGLYGTSAGAAGGALNTQAGASTTPSFWDQVGGQFAKNLGNAPFAAAAGS